MSMCFLLRFSSLLLNGLFLFSSVTTKYEPVFRYFLEICDIPCVNHFFTSILTHEETYMSLHEGLLSLSFSDIVLSYLYKFAVENPIKENESRCVYEKIHNLCLIIQQSCSTRVLGLSFKVFRTASILDFIDIDLPIYVRNIQWSSFLSILNPHNAPAMVSILQKSIYITRSLEQCSHINSYHVSALIFVTRMFQFEPNLLLYMISDWENYFSSLVNSMIKFCNHSIFHNSLRSFFEVSISTPGVGEILAPILTNECINNPKPRENRVLSAQCNTLVQMVIDNAKIFPKIKDSLRTVPEFTDYANGTLKKYHKAIEIEYGIEPQTSVYQMLRSFFE